MKKEENLEEFPEEIIIDSEYKYFTDKDDINDDLRQKNKEAIILCLQGKFDEGIYKFKSLSGSYPEFRFLKHNMAIAKQNSSLIDALAARGFNHNPSSRESDFIRDFADLKRFLISLTKPYTKI